MNRIRLLSWSITLGALCIGVNGCSDDDKQQEGTTPVAESKANTEANSEGATNDNSEVVEIPLNQIWAYKMSGTQLMTDSQKVGEEPPPEREFLSDIRSKLTYDPKRPVAQNGFAVEGTGIDALREAHRVMTTDTEPNESFPEDTPISLVFFSYEMGTYCHIHSVQVEGKTVTIRYRFVPHDSRETTEHFAIVPLGELKAGTYKVRIESEPMEKKYVEAGFKPISEERAKQLVCQSFSFIVKQKPEQ